MTTVFESAEELKSITKELADVVSEMCDQVQLLKEERADTTGEVKDAYNLVIQNKVWILQTLIGAYWRKSINLNLDKAEVGMPEGHPVASTFIDAPTVVVEEHFSNASPHSS